MYISRCLPGLAACAIACVCASATAAAQDHDLIGPGVVAAPTYEGARDYRVLPIPLIDISHGRFFADTVDGVGINVINSGPLTIGASMGYVIGYRQRDAPGGVGHLSDAAGARMFATYQSNGVRLTIGGTQSIGGTHGATADAALSYTAKLGPRFSLTPVVATTWADSKSNNRYFGIDAQQSQASGLREFAPGGGFKDFSAGLTGKYTVSRHWILIANVSGRELLGHDADSPIVERKSRPLGSIALGYMF